MLVLLLEMPVVMSSLKIMFPVSKLLAQMTKEVKGTSVMARQFSGSTKVVSAEMLKTEVPTVSCHHQESFVPTYFDAPSIKESLRTAATVLVKPVLAEARILISTVKTRTLLLVRAEAVHV